MDASNSVQRTLVGHVVSGAVRFLGATLEQRDAAFVIWVHSEISVAQDWTPNGDLLFEAVSKLRAGGGTALYDGVYFACKKLAAESAASRKVVLLASDGDDNQSHATLEETFKYCAQNSIAVNTLDESGQYASRGGIVLRRLSQKTGGLYYAPSNDKEILQVTDQLGAYWKAQYVGTATFPTLPEIEKVKEVYVVTAPDQLKFKATLVPEPRQ